MVGTQHKQRPNDVRLFLFSVVQQIARLPGISRLIRGLLRLLFGVAPGVPVHFSDTLRSKAPRRAFVSGVLIGFLFCFMGTVLLAWADNTLYGDDPNRVYLLEDVPNLVNYILLCPLYTGLAAHLITLVLQGWPTLSRLPLSQADSLTLPRRSLATAIFLIVAVATAVTINYVRESLDPAVYSRIGWWVAETGPRGERLLGAVGTYYVLLNFGLLVVCLAALLAFISMFFLCIRAGRALEDEPTDATLTFDALRNSLRHFTEAYLSVKLLAAVLMLNAYTWKFERPVGSFNLVLMGAALTVFGVFFISIPRYYVELEWFRFKTRRALATGTQVADLRDDLRPFSTQVVAHVIDVLVISGFILTFFTWTP